jgi:hypothetical protein
MGVVTYRKAPRMGSRRGVTRMMSGRIRRGQVRSAYAKRASAGRKSYGTMAPVIRDTGMIRSYSKPTSRPGRKRMSAPTSPRKRRYR